MVLASITLTMAMAFATVLGRHRRIQRADPSRQKKQTSTETSRDDFFHVEDFLTRRVLFDAKGPRAEYDDVEDFLTRRVLFDAKGPRAEYDDDGAGQSQMTSR
jgi:hypothetical protein